ncbi:MAG: caspase family protein [Acidobacteria bacterium]|nr:caspase family protein [Acidobacteriota bacterium]
MLALLCASFAPQTPGEKPELILQTGHAEKIEAIAYSPDGRYLATGSSDRTIKIWEALTGRELRALNGGTGIKALAYSPDGRLLASGGNDGKLRLWDTASGQERAVFDGHPKGVLALAFSSDGRWLASGGTDDKTVKLWEVATQHAVHSLSGHQAWVTALAFSPDSQTLVSGDAAGGLRLWELNTGALQHTLTAHKDRIRSLAFSADGERLASGGNDAVIQLWQPRTGQLLKSLPTQPASVVAVAFASNGQQLLICTNDHTRKRFALANSNSTGSANIIANEIEQTKLDNGENLNRYQTAVFSADGQSLAVCDGTRDVMMHQTTGAAEAFALTSRVNPVKAVAFSPDGRWLVTGNQDTSITLWETFSGRAVGTLYSNAGSINALAFSPDNQTLASGSYGGVIKLWEVMAARELKSWQAHNDGINALAFSVDGQRLFSASVDATIRSWEPTTGRELARLTGHQGEVTALSLGADGKLLASASADQTAKLWDVATGALLRTFARAGGPLLAVALAPDGKTLATGDAERAIKIRDIGTGNEMRTLNANGRVLSLAFSPDGKTLAAGQSGAVIQLWETDNWQPRASLSGHTGAVNALSFHPEGGWLVSGSEDGSARLWGLANYSLAATLAALRANNPDKQDWIVVTPDGLFDGSPVAWNQILWRFARNTFNVAPVEAFFSDFFYPELLADILTNRRPPPKENIAQLDRRQPSVKLALPSTTSANATSARTLKVRLEIAEAAADNQHTQGSGAQDVRLFRNGALVKVWHGDVLKGQTRATLESEVTLQAGENRLTAYAFNRANIKSADAQLLVQGAAALQRRGTAYVIAVGINRYSNPNFNLNFAVADAQLFSDEWVKQQTALKRFARIEPVLLTDAQATKANFVAALQRLAGAPLLANAPPALQKLQPAQPEDGIVVYFAGHGIALEQRFYLLPYELGYRGKREDLTDAAMRRVLPLAISDEELERLFEPIDAGTMLLVLDACNSGQALEAEEKRRGPMNAKGLAQLAYEKGMNILTAAQSYQVAKENSALGHGYLTYALIEDGLRKMAADRRPRDGQVVLREWFDFASSAVPEMVTARVNSDQKYAGRGLAKVRLLKMREVQRPRVFYRREAEAQPLIVGK